MAESQLNALEVKIDKLIELLQRIRLENNSLHKKLNQLSKENIMLLDKKKKAAESIKNLITQLKDELSCQTQR